MRLALPGSAAIHGAIVAALLLGFAWPKSEDAPAGETVTVDIVSVAAVSSNATETLDSDATETLVSAGAEAAAAVPPPTLEQVEPEVLEATRDTVQPDTPETLEPQTTESLAPELPEPQQPVDQTAEPLDLQTPEPVEPVAATELTPTAAAEPLELAEPASVEPLEFEELTTLAPTALVAALPTPERIAPEPVSATPPPTPTEVLQPVSETELKVAPVPHTLTRPRSSTPTYSERPPQQQPTETAAAPQPTPQRPPQQPSSAGNGGASNADSVASAGAPAAGASGTGGSAAVSQYPGQVLTRLRRALRYPSNAGSVSAEALVEFTVTASGGVAGLRLASSSGNGAIDEAALATVTRAAPFPPIPPDAGRTTWTFTIPLAFSR